jgi:hypothetical protein
MAKNYNIPSPQFSYGGTRLPKWANGLIVVGSLAIVGVVGYYIYKKLNVKKEEEQSKATIDQSKTELQQELNNGQKLSYPQSNYISASNTIATALDGCETFQSELQAISEVVKVVKNKADWLNLVKTFGVRKIDNCGWATGSTTYDLPTLLKDQLDTAGAYSINETNYKKSGWTFNSADILAEYLKTKGISF